MRATERIDDVEEAAARCAAYGEVAQAIREIRRAGSRGLSLEDLAARVGTTPGTLQRRFSAWAGLSPKRFSRVLAAARAEAALRTGQPVLDAALALGLSGPGRLHDLTVSIDACSPGELAGSGAGLAFSWGVGATPFGPAFLAETERGIHRLAFLDERSEGEGEIAALAEAWPRARLVRDEAAAAARLASLFAADESPRPLHLWVKGTNAQVAVWRALLRIPEGRVARYADVARWVETPRAVRAVAGAVARNPVAWAIPCHRVLRGDGDLAGYAWGLDRKAAILGWEAARTGALEEAPVREAAAR